MERNYPRRKVTRSLLGFGLLGLAVTLLAALSMPAKNVALSAPPAMTGLHVQGNQILNGSGQPVQLRGVDKAGTEYACAQGWGIFDGPTDAASITAMSSWDINAVRLPLNEDCWLGINGVNPAYSGANYQSAINSYITNLNAAGMAVVLDLHWNAPGTTLATGQQVMADQDHSPTFWSSVASYFKGNSSVVFDLYNEPHDISWSCWLNGGRCSGVSFQVAGMQELVNAVRNAGASNLILAGGLNWSNDLTGWLANRPSDPAQNLAASWHSYNFNSCNSLSCWQSQVSPVAQSVPVVAGEIGENDCAHSYIDSVMSYLDSVGASYLGWAWNTADCSGFPALISSYDGTPTAYGVGLQQHLISLAQGTASPTPLPTATATAAPTSTATATPTPTPTKGHKRPTPRATATATPV